MQQINLNIKTRNDLSFTGREANDQERFINWIPSRVQPQQDQWDIERALGKSMVGEICALHSVNEEDAKHAIQYAFNATGWVGGHGAESGFSEAIAELAVVGMRALQQGADMYREPKGPTAAEILEKRHHLFDVEILLRRFVEDGIYNLDSEELKVTGQTLAKGARDSLLEVCAWLEDMNEQAEAREAAQ